MNDKMILRIVAAVITPILPWLEAEAKKTDTPIDDLGLKIVKMLLLEGLK